MKKNCYWDLIFCILCDVLWHYRNDKTNSHTKNGIKYWNRFLFLLEVTTVHLTRYCNTYHRYFFILLCIYLHTNNLIWTACSSVLNNMNNICYILFAFSSPQKSRLVPHFCKTDRIISGVVLQIYFWMDIFVIVLLFAWYNKFPHCCELRVGSIKKNLLIGWKVYGAFSFFCAITVCDSWVLQKVCVGLMKINWQS